MLFTQDDLFFQNDFNNNFGSNGMLFEPFDKENYNKSMFYNPSEGLEKGNLFPDLYDKYKNYVPKKLNLKTEYEKKLSKIQEYNFAINELNLYLDLNPSNKDVYSLFKKYVSECEKLKEEFTRLYGPLCIEDLTDEYKWGDDMWPWTGNNQKYRDNNNLQGGIFYV